MQLVCEQSPWTLLLLRSYLYRQFSLLSAIPFVWCFSGEFGFGFTNNTLIDSFLNSRHLSAWYCNGIVRRNSLLVTHASYWSWIVEAERRQRTPSVYKCIKKVLHVSVVQINQNINLKYMTPRIFSVNLWRTVMIRFSALLPISAPSLICGPLQMFLLKDAPTK